MHKHALPARTAILMLLAALFAFSSCSEERPGIRGSGTVEATEITIASRMQGELLSVPVKEGQRVEADTLLARIDAEDLRLQLEQRRQQLRRLKARLELLREGAQPEEIRGARARLEETRHALELARSSLERIRKLYEGGSATPSDLDKAKADFAQAESRVEAAAAQLQKLESLPRPREVEAMEAQLAEAQAGVKRLERRLEDAELRAPRSGTITTVAREEGEYLTPGTPLFTLADLSQVYLTIFVPEPQLGRISLGQQAEISVDGMPERSFTGEVSRIAEEAEFTPKNVQTQEARAQLVYAVEIRIENSEGVFKIGMPADASISPGAE